MNNDIPIDLISLSTKLKDMKNVFPNNNEILAEPYNQMDFSPPPIPSEYTDVNGYTIIEGAASAPTTSAPRITTTTSAPTPISSSTATQAYTYNGIINENMNLQNKTKDMTSDFSTYEQQVVYQQQQLDNLMTVNFWLWITYYFKVCILIYYLFWVNKDMFFSTKIIFTIASILYPYLINIGQEYGYDIWNYTWSIINIDVYSQYR
jgi:hypothetical protein